ncbi:MAG: flagellar biosynthesis anti-sigma factor FlgM [Spirochaetaceae bacterium]|nr:flagellar biosynthesis anti-sigma factor FlgM [Spirochaetaceae bacterium]
MMINQLGGLDPLKNVQNPQKVVNRTQTPVAEDTVSVSQEARELAEAYYLQEVAASTPDVRSELVARLQEQIKDPAFLSPERIAAAADRFLDSVGL